MLNNEFPPWGGGTATVNLRLLEQFAKYSQLEIDLVTIGDAPVHIEQFSAQINLHRIPISVRDPHHATILNLASYFVKGLFYAVSLCRRKKYDLVFAWSAVPAGVMAMLLFYFHRIPFFVRVGGADIPGFEKRYRFIYPILKPLIRPVWKRSRVLIAKSVGEKEMIQMLCPGQPVTIIENGVDAEMFTPRAHQRKEGPLRLVCVARLIKRKGQETLIEALELLRQEDRQAKLELVGGGDDYQRLEKLVKVLRLKDQVSLLGSVDRSEIPDRYREADVFVLASHNEGMSISMLEAMAAGLPVIVTETPGTQEIVRNGENGWTFPIACTKHLANILRPLCDNPEIASRVGSCARTTIQERSWPSIAASYVELIMTGSWATE